MRSSLYYVQILFSFLYVPAGLKAATNLEISVQMSQESSRAEFNWLVESSSGSEARIGQFACGSYWIAPGQGDSGVRLLSLTNENGNSAQLSLDGNPLPHAHGLLDGSNNYGSYSLAANELNDLPKVFTPPVNSAISLVAAKQRVSGGGTKAIVGEVVDAYCIVTVLQAPPNDGANGNETIRPNIVGTKEFLTWDDFDLERLPRHSFIGRMTGSKISLEKQRWNHSTEIFSMKTWDGSKFRSYSEGGRAFRPHILHHDYGAGRAAASNDAMLQLLGNNPLSEIKPLLASIIAGGLDIWHFVYGRDFPGAWSSGAGQWGGQFMPAVFATSLLKDRGKRNRLMQTAAENLVSASGPQEMRQIMRGNTGVLLWGDGHAPSASKTTKISDQTRLRIKSEQLNFLSTISRSS